VMASRLGAASAAVAALAFVVTTAFAPASGASSSVTISTRIDGRDVSHSSAAHPITLHPSRAADVDIEVANRGSSSVTLGSVQLTGVVAGLTFFSYQTSVNLQVDPGQSTHLRYALDLTGLDGQATGLIPARISVSDTHRHELASQSFVSDVRGSLDSVYGLFGLALLVLTVAAIAGAAWAIATHRLPPNRWRRAVRLMFVGLGLGLVLVFTLSVFRVWAPTTSRWLVTVLAFAAVFFVIGYLTPTPATDEDEDELDESEFAADTPTPTGETRPTGETSSPADADQADAAPFGGEPNP